MSLKDEAEQVNDRILAAAARGDFAPFANALDDEVEIFDHVAYLFQGKAKFLEYLQSASAGVESMTFAFLQSTCRVVSDTTAVVNGYDRLTTIPKGGGMARVQSGRTTLVYVKKGGDWKIVAAHFSPLPKD